MVDYLSSFSKSVIHQAIEQTFPLTDEIALISAGAGWYAYRYGMTYSPGFMAQTTTNQFSQWFTGTWLENYGPRIGHYIAPIFVPSASPEVSGYMGLGIYLATCFSLNLLAKAFFGIKAEKGLPNRLPSALRTIGVDITPKMPPCPKREEEKITKLSLKEEEEVIALEVPSTKRPAAKEAPPPVVETLEIPGETEISIAEEIRSGSIAIESDLSKSDIFGDEETQLKGCCSWKVCF